MERTKHSSQCLCAKAIRQELKKTFPDTKFRVTSKSFSGGDSVDIDWTDGVDENQVDLIVGKYQYGHFDGMIDLYEYSNHRDDIPQSKYIMTQRSLSDELVMNCAKVIAKYYDIKIPETMEELSKSFTFRDNGWNNWHQLVWYFCSKLDFTGKNTIREIENYCGAGNGGFESVKGPSFKETMKGDEQ